MTGGQQGDPFFGDFVVIIGSENAPVRVPPTPGGMQFPPPPAGFFFDTGGRAVIPNFGPGGRALPGAFLLISVRGLTGGAVILINDRAAGHITGTSSGDLDTQLITIDAAVLSGASGQKNRLSFKNVSDAFEITTLACFFQQEA